VAVFDAANAGKVGTTSSAVGASLYRCSRRRCSDGQTIRSRDDSSWNLTAVPSTVLAVTATVSATRLNRGVKAQSPVGTSNCARQRVIQFLRDGSPTVDRDKVDILAEPAVGEMGPRKRGTTNEADAVTESVTEKTQ
jgi:hypothetical protein